MYIDTALLFDLQSVPKIFNAVAEGLTWIVQRGGVRHILHYPDDILNMAPPELTECGQALQTNLHACRRLGVFIAQEKVEGPSTCLILLEIEIDTEGWKLLLPREKLRWVATLVSLWRRRKMCIK